MRNFIAVLLAAILATSAVAADRPVGPETGQARSSADQNDNTSEADGGGWNPAGGFPERQGAGAPSELAYDQDYRHCWRCRWGWCFPVPCG